MALQSKKRHIGVRALRSQAVPTQPVVGSATHWYFYTNRLGGCSQQHLAGGNPSREPTGIRGIKVLLIKSHFSPFQIHTPNSRMQEGGFLISWTAPAGSGTFSTSFMTFFSPHFLRALSQALLVAAHYLCKQISWSLRAALCTSDKATWTQGACTHLLPGWSPAAWPQSCLSNFALQITVAPD